MISNRFNYCINYDYTTSRSCDESGCDTEGICRCGTIENTSIDGVDVRKIRDQIYNELYPNNLSNKRNSKISDILGFNESLIDRYCIDRILTILKIFNTQNWDIEIESGYYGQEIGDVTLNESIFDKLKSNCESIYSIVDHCEKIKFILNLEYGFIPDHIKLTKSEIIVLNKSDILFEKLNGKHINLVKSKNLEFYSDKQYDLPRGIVKKYQDGYKIIDGYHRMLSSSKDCVLVFQIN